MKTEDSIGGTVSRRAVITRVACWLGVFVASTSAPAARKIRAELEDVSAFFAPFLLAELRPGTMLDIDARVDRKLACLHGKPLGYIPRWVEERFGGRGEDVELTCCGMSRSPLGRLHLLVTISARTGRARRGSDTAFL